MHSVLRMCSVPRTSQRSNETARWCTPLRRPVWILLAPRWLPICTRLRPLNAMRVLVEKGIREQHRSSPLYGVAVDPERPSPPLSHFTSRSLAALCLLQPFFILQHLQECVSSHSFPFKPSHALFFLLAPGRRSFPGTSIVPFRSLGSITWVTRSVSHPTSSGRVVARSNSGLMLEF